MSDSSDQSDGSQAASIRALKAEVVRLKGLLDTSTFRHPADSEIEALGRRMANREPGDGFLFRDAGHLVDFCRELLTGEPHVNGHPLMSGLPNAPVSVRNSGDARKNTESGR